MSKTALITGVTGQDGAYLAKFLLDKGYKVYGTHRRLATSNFWRLQYLDILDKVHLLPRHPNYLAELSSLIEVIQTAEPDEVYHLAAESSVRASFEDPIGTSDITGLGVARLLEAIRQVNPRMKVYQASTSEMYGEASSTLRNEDASFQPSSPYAAARLYGYWMTRIYREGYGIFICNGILFNHESPLRGLEFVTRKISNAVAMIALGLGKELELGNLQVKRDWGYAPEYVAAIWLMLQQDEPDDYIVATGEAHSLQEFVEEAFSIAGLDWQGYVRTDEKLFRPLDIASIQGDYSRAKQRLGWEPKVKFNKLVKIMVEEDLSRWQRWQSGEKFPWDISNHPKRGYREG